MSTMKWTDEAIETYLRGLKSQQARGSLTAGEVLLRATLLELKRVRAWVKHIGCGTDCELARMRLARCLNGDPAPTDEQEASK